MVSTCQTGVPEWDVAPEEILMPTAFLNRLGLHRLLRLLVAGSIPPLWYEIAVLHYRGSFHSRFMWGPLVYLPLEMVGGLAAGLADNRVTQRLFYALSWGTVALGTFGTLMHLRGIRRQMGGLREWRYNVQTGPPIVAPPQVALFGLIGVFAVSDGNVRTLVRRLRLIGVADQLLLAVEAGYNHYQSYFANPLQYIPLVVGPALSLAQALAELPDGPVRRAGRQSEVVLAALALVAGGIGFGFHVKNTVRRPGGWSWQNLFYGPPLVAPLQLSGQGMFGLLANFFDRRSRR
jgi:hypothetical protein